jgi:hypothetical protein
MPAVTLIGTGALIVVLFLAFTRKATWAELVTFFGFAGLLFLVGVQSLWERWLSFGTAAGLRPPTYTPRWWLQILVLVLLLGLTVLLVVAAAVGQLRRANAAWFALGLAAASLFGALIVFQRLIGTPRHRLTREGLAIRYRGSWFLIPWEAIHSAHLGTHTENPVVAIAFNPVALLAPLPAMGQAGTTVEERDRLRARLVAGFFSSWQWAGAPVLVWFHSCGMPPGVFLDGMTAALEDLAARNALPPFSEL